jgi:hypothetical protein
VEKEGTYLGCSPVEGLSCLNKIIERSDDFLHRTSAIRSMRIDDIYIVQLQTFEGEFRSLDDAFSGETEVVDDSFAVGLAPVDLFVFMVLVFYGIGVWGK